MDLLKYTLTSMYFIYSFFFKYVIFLLTLLFCLYLLVGARNPKKSSPDATTLHALESDPFEHRLRI